MRQNLSFLDTFCDNEKLNKKKRSLSLELTWWTNKRITAGVTESVGLRQLPLGKIKDFQSTY